jgi:hypothetical protein
MFLLTGESWVARWMLLEKGLAQRKLRFVECKQKLVVNVAAASHLWVLDSD